MHGSADEGRGESVIPHVAPDPRGTILTASPKWPWAGSLADQRQFRFLDGRRPLERHSP